MNVRSRIILMVWVLCGGLGSWSVAQAACSGSSPNFTAASASTADVDACITAAATGTAGEIITIPPGSATWTTGVTFPSTKTIHLTAAIGTVTITNSGNNNLITLNESTTGHSQVSNLTWSRDTGTGYLIQVLPTVNGKAVLIAHNTINYTATSGDAFRFKTNRGVIWGNTFNALSTFTAHTNSAVRLYVGTTDAAWFTNDTIGANDTTGESNVYLEDNTFNYLITQTIDPADNARMVVRHNTYNNSANASHGQDSSQISGMRHVEYYNNTHTFTDGGACNGSNTYPLDNWLFMRGGTWIITDNNFPLLQSCAYGTKQTFKLIIENLRRNSGTYPCWGTTTPGVYPAPKQLGQGYSNGNITDPIYIWNNTGTGATQLGLSDYTPNECGVSAPLMVDYVQAGRDYFINGTARPGYTKYTYPHPLQGVNPTFFAPALNLRRVSWTSQWPLGQR